MGERAENKQRRELAARERAENSKGDKVAEHSAEGEGAAREKAENSKGEKVAEHSAEERVSETTAVVSKGNKTRAAGNKTNPLSIASALESIGLGNATGKVEKFLKN